MLSKRAQFSLEMCAAAENCNEKH